MKPISFIAEITKIETIETGLRLRVDTNELPAEDIGSLIANKNIQGNMLFVPGEDYQFSEKDLENLPEIVLEENEKSPAVRLRAVIFLYWKQSGGEKRADGKIFDVYYREIMEKYIDSIKQRLT